MKFSSRLRATGLGLVSVVLVGVMPLAWGQAPAEKTAAKKGGAPAAKKPADPARRVPDFFGQLGLTNDQRESIYKIQTRHLVKIEELRKELAAASKSMVQECETVLNDTQKQLLEQRRQIAKDAARVRRDARAKKSQEKPAS